MQYTELLQLTSQLINQPSISPNSAECFSLIKAFCANLGLHTQTLDHNQTQNLFISTCTSQQVFLLFCGHIDVVPPGDLNLWTSPPFQASVREDILYGRGACDMKSSVAAMLVALKHCMSNPEFSVPVGLLLTSDEEDLAIDGTRFAIEKLTTQGYQFQHALVGEPTSQLTLGDTLKTGRRGSLTGSVTIIGTQSHVAYANPTVNPIFSLAGFIQRGLELHWDVGHPCFPATQFCVTHVQTPSGASNVTPASAQCHFNFRFNPSSSSTSLKKQVCALLDDQPLPYEIMWNSPSEPFYKPPGKFCALLQTVIKKQCGIQPNFATNGGTSDARFIAPFVEEIVEFGPLNASAHAIDENIPLKDLYQLFETYQQILLAVNTQYQSSLLNDG